ncbi:FxLYD domain-containing protein [Paraburkholderia sp. J94]|uniref:FxLYD domain-containing protein n=1 Tax=Paraburkholderia sp. J94 TaxID=2805441 RepID=UPI002AB12D73|nr:FxLYD domain-containing protein [Paraburkholderia sp. J94]
MKPTKQPTEQRTKQRTKQPTNQRTTKRILLAAALGAAALTTQAQAPAQDALQLRDLRGVVDAGGVTGYITGTATNVTRARIDTATITINLLDGQGRIIGSASAAGGGIAPGQSWIFLAPTSVPYEQSVVAMIKTS